MKNVFTAKEVLESFCILKKQYKGDFISRFLREPPQLNANHLILTTNLILNGHLKFKMSPSLGAILEWTLTHTYLLRDKCVSSMEHLENLLITDKRFTDNQYLEMCNHLKFIYDFTKAFTEAGSTFWKYEITDKFFTAVRLD